MKIITITNQKGGSGKTTLSILVALAISEQGGRVLCVDCDPQAGLTALLTGSIEPRAGLYDYIIDDTLTPAEVRGLSLLTSDHRLDKIAFTMSPYSLQGLKKAKYDAIIFDTPPTVQGISRAAAMVANTILIPADISKTTIAPTVYTLEALREIKKPGRVVFIGKEPKPGAGGYTAALYSEFLAAVDGSFTGILPRSIAAQKAAAGAGKIPTALIDTIRGVI